MLGKISCGGDTLINPIHSENGVVGYDLILYINAVNENENFLANSASCAMDSETNRPVAGYLTFNMYYLKNLNLSDPFAWMDWVPITTHEIIHALGFTASMFKAFRNAEG